MPKTFQSRAPRIAEPIFRKAAILLLATPFLLAQEANWGLAVPVTVSTGAMHSHRAAPGGPVSGGIRTLLYPSLKLGDHWFGFAAVQAHTSPYFYFEAPSRVRKLNVHLLQGYAGYSRAWTNTTLTLKAGQLTSAFGSFPLRYDDTRNWLIDLPQAYGSYYKPVSIYGMPGAELNLAVRKTDLRLQFTNSSPSNRRGLLDSDQYGNWTIGGGHQIRQGFRIGGSFFRGPYLHRGHRFFFPGERTPKTLPATAGGLDIQWARGRWSANGEFQRFRHDYRAIPNLDTTLAYSEVKMTVNPRWYLAGRAGYRRSNLIPDAEAYELVVGYRPSERHLLKLGYLHAPGQGVPGTRDNVAGIQYVITFQPPAWAFR